jgi:hypothetical protein
MSMVYMPTFENSPENDKGHDIVICESISRVGNGLSFCMGFVGVVVEQSSAKPL